MKKMQNKIKWSIDQAHSEIAFKIKHLMIANVKGAFKTFDATIYTTAKDFLSAEINFWIETDSISTGDIQRDEHLKGSDFFDIEKYSQINFYSNSIGKETPEGKHELWGELTIKGVTKHVLFIVQFGGVINDPWGKERAGFTITGKIFRSDWGLVWNKVIETGGVMVSDEVIISCEIELTNEGEQDKIIELEYKEVKQDGL